ncbi:MAG: DUF1080 domain-containing protein [Verrucomicrobia bacterium]|nr:DUF1080 domain-containing protein [Verrucomicrobiota bacterium]
MRNLFLWLGLVVCAWPTLAAERKFDFNELALNKPPPGFRSTVSGEGGPGDWKVIQDEVPPLLPPLSPNAPGVTKRAVLAQLAQDPTDEHFPMLILDGETYGDFTLTTRFKTMDGKVEQMAGVAFRIQDEKNYYVVRASSAGNTFRFYKVVNGQRGQIIGPAVQISRGVWHELTVECKGNQIRCLLNGKELIPTLTDNSFSSGKVGFWTKSDSVCYFTDTKVTFTPREVFAQVLVRETCKKYPRLLGLEIYAQAGAPTQLRLIASKKEKEVGRPGGKTEQDVIERGIIYYGKEQASCSVVMPLRDQNGDAMAAARVTMKSFPGQTEESAIIRAVPIIKEMQARLTSAKELAE